MIFAHGPLGYLLTRATENIWRKKEYSQKQYNWFLILGFIAGIFPDVDLFYYYLFNATESHRTLPTHTPILYTVVCGLLALYAWKKKKPVLLSAAFIFYLGTWSHLLTDGIFAQVRYLYPFSKEFYGLGNIVSDTVATNLLAINFIIEGTIIAAFFYLLIRTYVERWSIRIPLVTLLLCTYIFGVLVVYLGNEHVAHLPPHMYYGDTDHDGIVNVEDRDIDNDGIPNIDDVDSDNDGESNPFEIAQFARQLTGVWYDRTNGGLLQIPARLGFITTIDAPRILLDSAGVSLRAEMTADYAQNSSGYVTSVQSNNFDRTAANIHTWLEHTGRLQEYADGRDQIGDILFFNNGFIAMVTGFDNAGQAAVLDVSPRREVKERLLSDVVKDEGEVKERGKILNSSAVNK